MIRVLRLLEYEYENENHAKMSMENWGVPATGVVRFGSTVIKSATLTDLDSQEGSIRFGGEVS